MSTGLPGAHFIPGVPPGISFITVEFDTTPDREAEDYSSSRGRKDLPISKDKNHFQNILFKRFFVLSAIDKASFPGV